MIFMSPLSLALINLVVFVLYNLVRQLDLFYYFYFLQGLETLPDKSWLMARLGQKSSLYLVFLVTKTTFAQVWPLANSCWVKVSIILPSVALIYAWLHKRQLLKLFLSQQKHHYQLQQQQHFLSAT